MNSREKGKRGEREAAEFLIGHGFEARRGVQYSGGGDSPDVVHSVPGVHFEVKRTEKLAIHDWIAQARADAKEGKLPVVLHKKNRRDWVVVLDANDFINFLKKREVS